MDEQVTNLSEDDHLSEEDKKEKPKITPPPSHPAPPEPEEEESENDDPTGNGTAEKFFILIQVSLICFALMFSQTRRNIISLIQSGVSDMDNCCPSSYN